MYTKKRRVWVISMIGLSMLMAALIGYRNSEHQNSKPDGNSTNTIETKITPISIPEGTRLKHLYITHQGMRGGAYYILKTTDAGIYMKITPMNPGNWRMLEGEAPDSPDDHAKYLAFGDTVKDCERASLVLLEDDDPVRDLEVAIAAAGALSWDGYDENDPMEGVLDSGDSYQLYLELTDGTTVTVNSYNAKPAGFSELLYRVAEIFHKNRDYSRYQIKDFDCSPCTKLYVCFRRSFHNGQWQLELQRSDNRWTVVLIDPKGYFTQAGTEIAEYQPMDGTLPFDRFLEVFKQHGAERWNGYEESDENSENSFDIRLNFENGKEFFMRGSLLPEGFEAFQEEFIEETMLFYNEQTGKRNDK